MNTTPIKSGRGTQPFDAAATSPFGRGANAEIDGTPKPAGRGKRSKPRYEQLRLFDYYRACRVARIATMKAVA